MGMCTVCSNTLRNEESSVLTVSRVTPLAFIRDPSKFAAHDTMTIPPRYHHPTWRTWGVSKNVLLCNITNRTLYSGGEAQPSFSGKHSDAGAKRPAFLGVPLGCRFDSKKK